MINKRINKRTSNGYRYIRSLALIRASEAVMSGKLTKEQRMQLNDLFNNNVGYKNADIIVRKVYDGIISELEKEAYLNGNLEMYAAIEDLELCKELTEDETLDLAILVSQIFR